MEKNKACIILAVWGKDYIHEFLEYSLPSLLASGNIPALAQSYKTRFVLLTEEIDFLLFKKNPIYKKLQDHCDVRLTSIDDLVVNGNYSTTLTFAYDRVVQQTGQAMLNTYFLFLTSDYIMANGSLQGLMRYIRKGYSGICAGNFQVIDDKIKPFLKSKINPKSKVMDIKPRELLKESFKCLHPITVSSLVNQEITHNYHANRFFYQEDSNLLIGRFYLLHMLCIKPETMSYQIGSSCDYSFIPAMCPSGNIAIINDSDDYLVVELQGKHQQQNFIHWGRYQRNRLTRLLAQWTTIQHRANAEHVIYFHTKELSQSNLTTAEKNLEAFLAPIKQKLQGHRTQPHYNHPYWRGAIKSFQKQREKNSLLKKHDYFDFIRIDSNFFLKKLYYLIFGTPPSVYPWHFRWREHLLTKQALKQLVSKRSDETVILYNSYNASFVPYFNWLTSALKINHHYYVPNLKTSPEKLAAIQNNPFANGLLMIRVDDLGDFAAILPMIQSILKSNAALTIIIFNEKIEHNLKQYNFQGEIMVKLDSIISHSIGNGGQVRANAIQSPLSFIGASVIRKINRRFSPNRKINLALLTIAGVFGVLLSCLSNMLPFRLGRKGHCTAVLLTLCNK